MRRGNWKRSEKFCADDGVEICTLSHTRSIDDEGIQKFKDKTVETTLAEDEVADFKKDWEKIFLSFFLEGLFEWDQFKEDEEDTPEDHGYAPSENSNA